MVGYLVTFYGYEGMGPICGLFDRAGAKALMKRLRAIPAKCPDANYDRITSESGDEESEEECFARHDKEQAMLERAWIKTMKAAGWTGREIEKYKLRWNHDKDRWCVQRVDEHGAKCVCKALGVSTGGVQPGYF